MDKFISRFLVMISLLLCLFSTQASWSANMDYEDDIKPSWGRCPWIRDKLKNGRVKMRSRGRIAKFFCNAGYELVGKRFATCVRSQWNNPVPICVSSGCYRLPKPANSKVTDMYLGALLLYDCLPGYTRRGPPSLYCDGSKWSEAAPICEVSTNHPSMSCDFEEPELCGWMQDPNHDVDWRRNQFSTPSGHVGTGPSEDHTFGAGKAGFYMYLEASTPQKENDVARLYSPVYSSSSSPGCFIFWYHMYGDGTGMLRVYVKSESQVLGEVTASWEKTGDQGNQWLRANVSVPETSENFQIVIEGVRGPSYESDLAIDDVKLVDEDCSSFSEDSANSSSEAATSESCRGRCHEAINSGSCGCSPSCFTNNSCCVDYSNICNTGGGVDWQEETPESSSTTDATHIRTSLRNPITATTTENWNELSTFTEPLTSKITEGKEMSETSAVDDRKEDVTTTVGAQTFTFVPAMSVAATESSTIQRMPATDSRITIPITNTDTRTYSNNVRPIFQTTTVEEGLFEESLTTARTWTSSDEVPVPSTFQQNSATTSQDNPVTVEPATTTTITASITTTTVRSPVSSIIYKETESFHGSETTTTTTVHTYPIFVNMATGSNPVTTSPYVAHYPTESTELGSTIEEYSPTIPVYRHTHQVSRIPWTGGFSSSTQTKLHSAEYTTLAARTSQRFNDASTKKSSVTEKVLHEDVTEKDHHHKPIATTVKLQTMLHSGNSKTEKVTFIPESEEDEQKSGKRNTEFTPESRADASQGGESSSVGGAIVAVCLLLGSIASIRCFFVKRRKRMQSKLSEESEIKFLSDNEVIEFCDSSERATTR